MSISIGDLDSLDFSDVVDPSAATLPPVHPGAILREEFLEPMGISPSHLAKSIAVPPSRVKEIVAGKRAVSTDTGLRLSRFFGLHDGFWIGLQADYDTAKAKDALGQVLANIRRFEYRGGVLRP